MPGSPETPAPPSAPASTPDRRNIATGYPIAAHGYCDQPYVVVNDDGSWCCVMTTGPGLEGDLRQHVVSAVSRDEGRTWSALVAIEPEGPPEASWVMPVRTPAGRIYAIYVHNTDNVREVRTPDGGRITRADVLGHYVYKVSEDGGRSWSTERYEIPVREFRIDRQNVYGGALRFFWGVGKPVAHEGVVYVGAAKVGNLGGGATGMLLSSEGMILKSDNLLHEPDPARVRWETLPQGDVGLRAPVGPVAEEHSLVALSDGSLYTVYRTVEGYLCAAYSRDGGRTWDGPGYATYAPSSTSKGRGTRTKRGGGTGTGRGRWRRGGWRSPGVRAKGPVPQVVAIVDGGPKVISFVVNGRLCDGGLSRQYGWGRIGSQVGDVNGAGTLRLTPGEGATPGEKGGARLLSLRVYTRALRTSEAVGNWRAGP